MAVDDAEGGRLFLQMKQDTHQHDVLDDVGKAAGMKGVTVVQSCGPFSRRRGTFYSSCPGLSRASTRFWLLGCKDVDGRDRPGHDERWDHPPRTGGMVT
jgi:hypothetical protein